MAREHCTWFQLAAGRGSPPSADPQRVISQVATCLVLGVDSRQRSCIAGYARLERRVGVELVTVWHDSWQEFCEALGATPSAFGIITDGVDLRSGCDPLGEVLAARPDTDVFLYGRPQDLPLASGGAAWLLPSGIMVSGVVESEVDGPSRLREALLRGYGSRYTRRFLHDLKVRSPGAGVIADRLIRETAREVYSVARWADEDGVSVRTLERQMGRMGRRTPGLSSVSVLSTTWLDCASMDTAGRLTWRKSWGSKPPAAYDVSSNATSL